VSAISRIARNMVARCRQLKHFQHGRHPQCCLVFMRRQSSVVTCYYHTRLSRTGALMITCWPKQCAHGMRCGCRVVPSCAPGPTGVAAL